jgi:hypothetical protein
MGLPPLHLRQQAEHHRPRRLVLLQIDHQLAEGPRLGVAPELADPVGSVEVGQHEDVEQLGASGRREGLQALRSAASISSKVTDGPYDVRATERVRRMSAHVRETRRITALH